MANLAILEGTSALARVWENELDVVKGMIGAQDLDDNEFKAFCAVARNVGLNPLARQIYAIPFRQKVQGTQDQWRTRLTIVTGIDGYRTIADRSGLYAGQDEPEFGPSKAVIYIKEVWENKAKQSIQCTINAPEWAKVTVYKIVAGVRCSFTAKVLWSEYFPESKPGRWPDMPFHMLAKCAEANALRKAFPNDLSGLFTDTETERMHSLQPTAPAVDLYPDGSIPDGPRPGAPAELGANGNDAADALARAAAQSNGHVIEAELVEPERPAAEPSGDQRAMFFALAAEIGMPAHVEPIDKAVNYSVWAQLLNLEKVESWTELTRPQVGTLIDWMTEVKAGKKKLPNIAKRRDQLSGQMAMPDAPSEPRGAIDSFKGLIAKLSLSEGQVDKLLTACDGRERSADDYAVAGWLRGLSTFDEFLLLFGDPFDELEELGGG